MIRPKIRVARNSDVPALKKILEANGMWIEGLDWSEIHPYWLLAIHKGSPVGCINFMVGKPFGYVGSWAILPGVRHLGIGMYLLWQAEELLKQAGCDAFVSFSDNGKILKKLDKVGAVECGEGTAIIKRIYREREAISDGPQSS